MTLCLGTMREKDYTPEENVATRQFIALALRLRLQAPAMAVGFEGQTCCLRCERAAPGSEHTQSPGAESGLNVCMRELGLRPKQWRVS